MIIITATPIRIRIPTRRRRATPRITTTITIIIIIITRRGCGCGAHHDTSEAGLQRRLLFVFAAAACLVVGAGLPLLRPQQTEIAALLSMLGALLAAAPIVWDTLAGLQARTSENTEFYMNQFMTLAVAACLASGQYLTGGVVAIVLLVGHILEDRGMLGASEAISSLLDLSRHRARRLKDDGTEEDIDAQALAPGDAIRVRPGDILPTDGTVRQGRSTIDQATITGESLPVEVAESAAVFAGTVNLTGLLRVEVTHPGRASVLGRVQQIVEEAQRTRAPIVRLTEEYARYYMPLILLIAGAVLYFTHDFQRAISVIIVSIPCTFVMAGPTAMVAALASASRLGILVKSTRFFEAAGDIDTVIFDKTGTLTTGQLRVAKLAAADTAELLRVAAALEQHSTHPIARAIVQAARDAGVALARSTPSTRSTASASLRYSDRTPWWPGAGPGCWRKTSQACPRRTRCRTAPRSASRAPAPVWARSISATRCAPKPPGSGGASRTKASSISSCSPATAPGWPRRPRAGSASPSSRPNACPPKSARRWNAGSATGACSWSVTASTMRPRWPPAT
ncbi:MAG: HAD-IC family P-type ATPase [Verrucomicrobiota bacterium]